MPGTGGIQFDDTQVSNAWLADSDNGATAMDMTGSDQVWNPCFVDNEGFFMTRITDGWAPRILQGAYNSYSSVHTYWADTTAMDNIRGADITDGTIAGSIESISANVTHTDSNLAAP